MLLVILTPVVHVAAVSLINTQKEPEVRPKTNKNMPKVIFCAKIVLAQEPHFNRYFLSQRQVYIRIRTRDIESVKGCSTT